MFIVDDVVAAGLRLRFLLVGAVGVVVVVVLVVAVVDFRPLPVLPARPNLRRMDQCFL